MNQYLLAAMYLYRVRSVICSTLTYIDSLISVTAIEKQQLHCYSNAIVQQISFYLATVQQPIAQLKLR